MKKIKQHKLASDFWMDEDIMDSSIKKGDDIMELSSYRRAVANFVRIVTGENIPVRYSTGQESYTNGKEVTISASTKLEDRDSMVGLALHEGSHCILTDFEFLKSLHYEFGDESSRQATSVKTSKLFSDADRLERSITMAKHNWEWRHRLKDMINYVEDRRIDAFITATAPGYRPYYQALYDKYFNSKVIDKGLASAEYRTEDWESYLFRILNLTNPKRDLKALKKLEAVWNMLDIANISRLKSTAEAAEVAFDMLYTVYESIVEAEAKQIAEGGQPKPKEEEQPQGSNGSSPMSGDTESPEADDNPMDGRGGGDPETGDEDDDENDDGGSGPGGSGEGDDDVDSQNYDQLSDSERQKLRKKIEEQRNMNNNSVKKKKMSKKSAEMINSIDDSDIQIQSVATDMGKFQVTVVRKFNKRLAETVDGGLWYRTPDRRLQECIDKGIQQGTVLGKKLKVRAEERSTRFNRLRSGKIDKRMIHTAGFNNESIFDRLETFAYKPGIIHISIDNSGSMGGKKFNQSMQTAAAIAKACSMIENMDCVISLRSTAYMAGSRSDSAMIVIAYDSRRQSINEMRVLLPYLHCTGATPEGLCFHAIMEEIIKSSSGKDSFFLNFSDGCPYYSDYSNNRSIAYSGESAYRHTRQQVNKMIAEGINVISYYISDRKDYASDHYECVAMRTMYGRDAQFINVDDINAIAKTINTKFLEAA